MQIIEKIMIEQEKHISTECDKCKKEIETEDSFDAFDYSLTLIAGTIYPEGNFTKTKSIDLCKDCAKMLFAFLEDNDYRINKSES